MHAFRPLFSEIAEHRLVGFAETPDEATRVDSTKETKEAPPAQSFLERGRDLIVGFFKSPDAQKKVEHFVKEGGKVDPKNAEKTPAVPEGQSIDSGEKSTDLPVQLKDAPPVVVAIVKVLQDLVNMLSGNGERGASIEDMEKSVQGLKETKKNVEAQASGSESKELQERINRLSQRITELEARIAARERDHAAHARTLEQAINVQGAPVLTGVRAEARGDVFVVRGSETQIRTISAQMSQRGFNFKAVPQNGVMTIYAENGKLPTCRDIVGGARGDIFTKTQNVQQWTEVGDRCHTAANQKVECLTQRLKCIKQQYDCMLMGAERMQRDVIRGEQMMAFGGNNMQCRRGGRNNFGGMGAARMPGSFGNSPNFGGASGGFAPQQGFGRGGFGMGFRPDYLDFEQRERELEAKRQEYAEVGRELQKAKREAAQPRAIPHVVQQVPSNAPDILPRTGSYPHAIPPLDQRPPTRSIS